VHNPVAMICGIYARFSSDLQREASIEDQIRKCREYAGSRGWFVAENHIYTDYALSGEGSDRPGLKAMLKAACGSTPGFGAILVDDSSRLSRDLGESLQMQKRLEFAGMRLVAVSQGIDSADEQASVLLTVHGLVDSLFLKGLSQKTRRGMEGLVIRGQHTGGRCYGYRATPLEGGGSKLVVHEPEAVIVRRIFEMVASGMSLKRVAKLLNAEGVRSPRPGIRKKYDTWAPSAIYEIIRRELYIGRKVWGKTKKVKVPGTNRRVKRPRPSSEWRVQEMPHLGVVSQDLWDATQAAIKLKQEKYSSPNGKGLTSRTASSPYLLSGFLKCSQCGGNIIIVRGRSTKYGTYGCAQHFCRGACKNDVRMRQEDLERLILERLQAEVLKPEVVQIVVEELRRALEAEANSSEMITHFEARRAELESELKNLTTAIAKAKASTSLLEAIADRERELRSVKTQLKAARDQQAATKLDGLYDHVISRLADIRSLVEQDVARAKLELGKHIDTLIVEPDPCGGGYLIKGHYDLVGDRFPKTQATSLSEGCGQNLFGRKTKTPAAGAFSYGNPLVPGGGIEPPRY
jgi:site-specific DNA recombinase